MPHIPSHTPLSVEDVGQSLRPLLQGQPGSSPLTQAAIEQFKQAQLPIIQGQLALQGLSRSPALSVATAQGLGQALPQFIGADIENRLRAAQLGLGTEQLAQSGSFGAERLAQSGRFGTEQLAQSGRDVSLREFATPFGLGLEQRRVGLQEFAVPEQLAQSGIGLAANISNQQRQRQLQAAQQAGQLQLGFGSQIAVPLAQLESSRQQAAIQALATLGGQQQQVQQAGFDASEAERARLQAIAQQPALGLFGASGLAPAIGAAAGGK